MASNSPSFPSLYNPHFELDSRRHGTIQPNAKYLDNARDVYLFTLYWTFILYAPLFLITGACASLFIALEPLRRVRTRVPSSVPEERTKAKAPKASRKRSIAYGVAVFLAYAIAGTLLTVFGSTVVGFLIAGVYAAGQFSVSTWVPFVWALLQSLVAVTSMCSLIIDII